ncbi:hypothetical protein ABZ851_32675 [Streptomyces sp. NPDC047049]|uniref:hypothetical protein n=1 Tax=Streptomyces sp. NPDC047049 TaxID=3156688 RepID=UPI0033F1435C
MPERIDLPALVFVEAVDEDPDEAPDEDEPGLGTLDPYERHRTARRMPPPTLSDLASEVVKLRHELTHLRKMVALNVETSALRKQLDRQRRETEHAIVAINVEASALRKQLDRQRNETARVDQAAQLRGDLAELHRAVKKLQSRYDHLSDRCDRISDRLLGVRKIVETEIKKIKSTTSAPEGRPARQLQDDPSPRRPVGGDRPLKSPLAEFMQASRDAEKARQNSLWINGPSAGME